jgi:hypothetical protein
MSTVRSLKATRALLAGRLCFICLRTVAPAAGVYHADLSILTHQETCSAVVDGQRRIYDRSPRGRWRPRREVLARLAGSRAQPMPSNGENAGGAVKGVAR